MEDTILHTTQELGPHKGEGEGLVTRQIVHEFWQMALSEVLAVLRNNCVRRARVCLTDYNIPPHIELLP